MRLSTQIHVRPGPDGTFRSVAEHARELEHAGLDIAWVPESYGFDAPTAMGFLAAHTERLLIGSGILPLYTRTPTLIAETAAGLDFVSGGRALLGLGASGPQVVEGFHGIPFDHPLQRTREIVEICRRVWRREVTEHRGAHYTLPLPPERGTGLGKPLKLMHAPVRPDIPVYLAALGAQNVALAAEIADGWLPLFFAPEHADRVWGDALKRGTARRSPGLGPLEISAGWLVAIGEHLEDLRNQARPRLALYAGGMGARGKNFFADVFRRYGFADEVDTIQDLYLSRRREQAEAAVPLALCEQTTLIGSREYVRDRVAAYRAAGVTILEVHPIGPSAPADTIRQLREIIATV